MRVLIVEDEVVIALDLQSTLEGAGDMVIGTALNIADAVEIVQAGHPELALININLREGRGAGIENSQKAEAVTPALERRAVG